MSAIVQLYIVKMCLFGCISTIELCSGGEVHLPGRISGWDVFCTVTVCYIIITGGFLAEETPARHYFAVSRCHCYKYECQISVA